MSNNLTRTVTIPFKTGTTAQNNAYTGTPGEVTIDSTLGTLRVHDGATAGGQSLLRQKDVLLVAGATQDAAASAAAAASLLQQFIAAGGASGVNTGALSVIGGIANPGAASLLVETNSSGKKITVASFLESMGAELTDLPLAGPLAKTDYIPVVQADGTEKRVSLALLADAIDRINRKLL